MLGVQPGGLLHFLHLLKCVPSELYLLHICLPTYGGISVQNTFEHREHRKNSMLVLETETLILTVTEAWVLTRVCLLNVPLRTTPM